MNQHPAVRELDDLVLEFNRLTNRPLRAYAPGERRMGGKANVGYVYARNLGEQAGNRCSLGIVTGPGGGLGSVPGLSGLCVSDMIDALRQKMADPEWMQTMTLPVT